MEVIIFIGIQATGKSTFYLEKFFNTHMRISMDMLNTRHKEQKFLDSCYSIQQPFVVDNTNPGKADRYKYIEKAKENKYKVIGYYFQSKLQDSLKRNTQRQGKENIPEIGIKGTFSKLEIPSLDEGFDELYYVEIKNDTFEIKDWKDEI
ncbi:MAG: ATP-binding protein [Bacteroidota bacterium]